MDQLLSRVFTFGFKDSHRYGGLLWLVLFLILSYILRYFSFQYSELSWDEATYILMGRGLLNGDTLYVDMWDTKPPGIYWISAIVQYLFHDAVYGFRVLAMFSIGLTAFAVYHIARLLYSEDGKAAIMSGVFYIAAMSYWCFGYSLGRGTGMEANTEMFFLLFTSIGFYGLLKKPLSFGYNTLAGLSLGLGFIIKYFVLFDMVAFCLIGALLIRKLSGDNVKQWLTQVFLHIGTMGVCMILPFAALVGYYYFVSDHFDAFYEVTFEVGGRYSSEMEWLRLLSFIGDFFYLGGIISVSFALTLYFFLRNKIYRQNPELLWLLLWLVLIIAGVSIPAKFFGHYAMQFFLPFALFSGALFSRIILPKEHSRVIAFRWIAGFLLITLPVINYLKIRHHFGKPDYARVISNYLNKKEKEAFTLWVDNAKHIVNYYTQTERMTKYVHPSLLYKADHLVAINIDREAHLNEIFEKHPDYVLYKYEPSSQSIKNRLAKSYIQDTIFDNRYVLYRSIHHQE